jgi:hypothetical protein
MVAMGLPPRELTSSAHSLTWREFLTSLTTYFFNHELGNPPLQNTIAKSSKARDGSVNYKVA